MWLINVDSLELVEFPSGRVPPYNILSHRWSDDEPFFKEFRRGWGKDKIGYRKIKDFCTRTKNIFGRQIEWVWVDTVCIDRRNSAELTESINSMWNYYRQAHRCFVYLSDVPSLVSHDQSSADGHALTDKAVFLDKFRASNWFTRGWTLQELIAPRLVTFFTGTWQVIGTTHASAPQVILEPDELCGELSGITRIPAAVLRGARAPGAYSIAQRMSWAARRQTSRVEDAAYSLLGLFDISMPLIYGEGAKAFRRLQLEIIRVSPDQSIFAWAVPSFFAESMLGAAKRWHARDMPILAESPRAFASSGNVERLALDVPFTAGVLDTEPSPYAVTNHGLELLTSCEAVSWTDSESARETSLLLIPLNCMVRAGLTVRGTFICHLPVVRLACGHYGRMYGHLFALGFPRAPQPQRTKMFLHIAQCENSGVGGAAEFERLRIWHKPQGKQLLKQRGVWTDILIPQ